MKKQRGPAVALIAVLALVLASLVLDGIQANNPIRDAFSYVAAPVQYGVAAVERAFSGVAERMHSRQTLVEENRALREENDELRKQIVLLQEAELENESLRRLLEFKQAAPTQQLLAAEVIGRDPNNLLGYLVIDRGRNDGIEVNMPVLAADGLVGRISSVTDNSATVLLITDPSSSVSALVQRSRATGVVQGAQGHRLVLRYVTQDSSIERGDIVISSGLGGNLPTRLVIGQVVEVLQTEASMFKEAVLVPAVSAADLERVMVLLNFAPVDVANDMRAPQE